jgi:4-hydroxy-tetrahydrodipicolinate reductase
LTENKIRVAIAGVAGKMGLEAARTLSEDSRFEVCAGLVRDVGRAIAYSGLAFPLFDDPALLIEQTNPDIWLDLTDAKSVVHNVDYAIQSGIRPVVGATGYLQSDIQRWDELCKEKSIGGIACPNFAIGALLMTRFAKEAAKYFKKAEIIELHHDGKKDAPSGTAKRTAAEMEEEMASEIPIHSVRLPGLVAHQEVLFGGVGEVLTIRHDSLSRQSFMSGILVACKEVGGLSGMVYGLEHLLW